MNPSFFLSLHFLWIILVALNLIVQVLHFYNEDKPVLFTAKKVTTPLLLLFALFIVVYVSGSSPLIPCLILAAMAIGELGMEGSNVVQARRGDESATQTTSIFVVLAGVLFLLVNVFIGVTLMMRGGEMFVVICSLVVGLLFFALIFSQVFRVFKPASETKNQMMLYSIGIVILFSGALTDIYGGISVLGAAAVILTISDTLVLVRMGADFKKETRSGFRTLFLFLLGILLLYYAYIAVLIHIGSPFPVA